MSGLSGESVEHAPYGWTSYDMHYDGKRDEWVIARTVREEVRAFPRSAGYEPVGAYLDELRARGEETTREAEAMVVCPTCHGQGCEHGCGQCYEFPSTAGPDAHRMCVTCIGAGEVKA